MLQLMLQPILRLTPQLALANVAGNAVNNAANTANVQGNAARNPRHNEELNLP
jgi:hypothetical protein